MARQERRGQVLEVKDKIINCTACTLSDGEVPVPFRGPSVASLAVLGESPNPASEQVMEDLLRAAGFQVDQVAFLNVVSCPVKGRPPQERIDACRSNLVMQMELIEPKYVILAGGVPLEQYKTDVKIKNMHGRAFLINRDTLGFSIYSPTYVMRKGGTGSQTGKLVLNDLIKFRDTFFGRPPYECLSDFGDTCVLDNKACVRDNDDGVAWAGYFTDDGTPWCSREHQEQGG